MVGQFFFFPLPHGVHRKQGHYPGGLKKERERKKKREREAGVYTSHILKPEKEKKKKGHAQIVKTAEGGKGRHGKTTWNTMERAAHHHQHTHTYITTHALYFVYVCINIFILNEADLSLDRDDIFFSPATWIKAKKRKKKHLKMEKKRNNLDVFIYATANKVRLDPSNTCTVWITSNWIAMKVRSATVWLDCRYIRTVCVWVTAVKSEPVLFVCLTLLFASRKNIFIFSPSN